MFTSRRSGGTWLAELFSQQSGVLLINEPTETGKLDRIALRRDVFPPNILEQGGIPVSMEDCEWLIRFFKAIVEGRIKIRQPWNPFTPVFHFKTDRVLIKTHVTKPYFREIIESFPDAAVIWLVRHPIAQSLSSRQTGSRVTSGTYLQAPGIQAELTPQQLRTCRRILEGGDTDECILLDWFLENLVPIRHFSRMQSGVRVSYEELVTERAPILEILSAKSGLEGLVESSQRDRPSMSTKERSKTRTITHALRGDAVAREALISSWLDAAPRRMVDQCRRLLDTFHVDLYTADDPMIAKKYRLVTESSATACGAESADLQCSPIGE